MIKIGITERGDAGIDFSWVEKLLDGNIIISKCLNDKLIEELVRHQEKVIFHCTCTGYGGTVLEPRVMTWEKTKAQVVKLIAAGFDKSRLVLRIDPIIPTPKGIQTAKTVLEGFKELGIKRVRYSFLDMYKHVQARFTAAGLRLPYKSFCAPDSMIAQALTMLQEFNDFYELESCAENTPHALGCVSQKDFDIFGVQAEAVPAGFQRKGCLCIAGKTELLLGAALDGSSPDKKVQCSNQCLYCFWSGPK